jgi:hypothetical protein
MLPVSSPRTTPSTSPPLHLPATYAVTYLLAFTLSTCVIVHTVLYHGRSLLNSVNHIMLERDLFPVWEGGAIKYVDVTNE